MSQGVSEAPRGSGTRLGCGGTDEGQRRGLLGAPRTCSDVQPEVLSDPKWITGQKGKLIGDTRYIYKQTMYKIFHFVNSEEFGYGIILHSRIEN